MTVETLLAALGLLVCLLLLGRMAIGEPRRRRLDAAAQRSARAIGRRARVLWHQHRLQRCAVREADALIRRARQAGPATDRDGPMRRPPSFTISREGDAPDGRARRDH